jgi:hypothetical protein
LPASSICEAENIPGHEPRVDLTARTSLEEPALSLSKGMAESQSVQISFSTLSIHLHSCPGGPLSSTLSSRLERIRISYIAVPPKPTYAAFRKESRTKFANATKLDRKSGVAQGRDLQFHSDRTQMPTSDPLTQPDSL